MTQGPLAKKQLVAMKKFGFTVFVFMVAATLLVAAIIFAPKDTIVGTWQNNKSDSTSKHDISIEFQANGKEVQTLKTAQGLLVVRGNYTLNAITLKHTFLSASLNGEITKLLVVDPNIGYRCKVAGNDLELDSRALAVDMTREHYLPLNGKQILLSRADSNN